MRRIMLTLGLVAVAGTLSCGTDQGDPSAPDGAVLLPAFVQGGHPAHGAKNFNAPSLHGSNEVPANDSKGAGTAWFKLSDDGLSLDYKLIVANIDNVTQSHIHLGQPGANGGVVVFLFGFVAGGVTQNGVLAEGTITAANLINALAGEPLSTLIEHMRSGNAYVNVHTVAIPGGEIRDQIQ